MFVRTPPWPVRLGWPYMAWLIVHWVRHVYGQMWSVWLVFCYCGFHLSVLWWIRIRGLWKLPNGRDWLKVRQATADTYLCLRDSNTVLAQSQCGLCVLVHTRFFWALRGPWRVQVLILNVILPLLLSCWGFSFALGCGVLFLVGYSILLLTMFSSEL